jgi:hypothetical protein
MKAIVSQPFLGVEDGEIYPREFAEGDPVTGDLAAVAVREKWAKVQGHPLDHDGDGKPGGSPAGENATRRRGRKPKGEE